MPGKLCMGNDNVPNDFKLSQAYCEGRELKVSGEDYLNPFAVGDAASHNAFNRGFISSVEGGANETTAQDCCALPRIASDQLVPDVVGSLPGVANTTLLTAGYNPKPVNGLLGAIISQDPIAGATALTSTTVEYTAGA